VNWLLPAGSLIAVLLLALASKWMGLGGDIRLNHDAAVRIAEAEGFTPADLIVDRAGIAAIARDARGRHMLIRRHGVNFVTRILHAPLDARLDQKLLTLGTDERSFGRITLDLGDQAAIWAAGLRQVR
jgi:hypothetical protein